eukprot:GHRQ01012019.1.p1 GENE.GHRQ01012019.1~~GHRQ01012019.1.p1  ORF type:complete len:256 (+),score=74.39 GHRQ01012019.1:425-1192(+)
MMQGVIQQNSDCGSDVQALLAEASTAGAADSQQDSLASPGSLLRRVTFSEEYVVHQMPGAPSSIGCDSEAVPEVKTGWWQGFKQRVKALKRDVLALYYAVHDPRTPLLSKLLPCLVLAYALSPLDLIPDFIPVLGLLDDMLLLPLGLWASYKLIPAQVMQDCRQRAEEEPLLLERNWVVAVLVGLVWTAGLLLLVHWLVVQYGDERVRPYEWAVLCGTGGVAAIVFSVWMISRLRYEARRRDEWNAHLLADASRA